MNKFIIWGTGKVAESFVSKHYNGFFRRNMIIAFVDNSNREEPETFFNIPIIVPNQISHYDMDYILIASSYDEEITKQVINELYIDEKKILHIYDIYRFMYDYWENNLNLSKKKILCTGNKDRYDLLKPMCKHRLNLIGFVDINISDNIYDYDYDYILIIGLMDVKFEMFEIKIMETLHQKFNIPMERILCESIYTTYRHVDIKIESNSSARGGYSDEKFLIINVTPHWGLANMVGCVAENVRYARENDYIPVVDMMTYPNQYLDAGEIGKVNAWENYFLQPTGYSLDDAMNSKNAYWSATRRVEKINDKTHMLDFLQMNRQLKEFCQLMKEQLSGKKLLGVLFRGTDYANMKPYEHQIQPTLEQMITKVKEKVNEWGGFDGIYICTEVEEAIKEFEKELSIPVYYHPQKRFPQNTDTFLALIEFERGNDKYLRGAEYFSALLWLSRCDSLIAGRCGGSNLALQLNDGKYKNKYLFTLGRYGIDDISNQY